MLQKCKPYQSHGKNASEMSDPSIILIIIVTTLLLTAVVGLFITVKNGFILLAHQIRQSVLPRALTISPQAQDVADMAIELWRLERRLAKTQEKLSSDENKALQNTVEKIKRFVQKNDIEVTDYAGQAYNDGMNLDIIASEKDSSLKKSIVYETHEPAVSHKGVLIRKAKVIIHEK